GEWNDIHPEDKYTIGYRLSLQARRMVYGERKLVASGPLFDRMQVSGQKIILHFRETGSGLTTCDGKALQQIAIAGADKKFDWAKAVIKGNTVEVWSNAVPQPAHVRYAWADNPQGANLCNNEGLPASPFTTEQ
ncbi:MAG TPA: sialate O-acetylesterase, partial [Lacibacter sp.]|nr:sialate O-acetylesterase [Lacibacter sp.]